MTNLWFLYPNQIFKIHSTFFRVFLELVFLEFF